MEKIMMIRCPTCYGWGEIVTSHKSDCIDCNGTGRLSPGDYDSVRTARKRDWPEKPNPLWVTWVDSVPAPSSSPTINTPAPSDPANARQVGGNHYRKVEEVGGQQHWDRAWILYGPGPF